jgi:hypothetical protein
VVVGVRRGDEHRIERVVAQQRGQIRLVGRDGHAGRLEHLSHELIGRWRGLANDGDLGGVGLLEQAAADVMTHHQTAANEGDLRG